jgi:hypothetical protein
MCPAMRTAFANANIPAARRGRPDSNAIALGMTE